MRPVSWCSGCGVVELIWMLSSPSVLLPTPGRDVLSMVQSATLRLRCMQICVAGPQPPGSHQQAQWCTWFLVGPLRVLEQGLCTSHRGELAVAWAYCTSWAHRHLQHIFYNLLSPWPLRSPKQIKGDLRFGSSVKITASNHSWPASRQLQKWSAVVTNTLSPDPRRQDLSELGYYFSYLLSWLWSDSKRCVHSSWNTKSAIRDQKDCGHSPVQGRSNCQGTGSLLTGHLCAEQSKQILVMDAFQTWPKLIVPTEWHSKDEMKRRPQSQGVLSNSLILIQNGYFG